MEVWMAITQSGTEYVTYDNPVVHSPLRLERVVLPQEWEFELFSFTGYCLLVILLRTLPLGIVCDSFTYVELEVGSNFVPFLWLQENYVSTRT